VANAKGLQASCRRAVLEHDDSGDMPTMQLHGYVNGMINRPAGALRQKLNDHGPATAP
jgi:hypothetical protein